MIPDFDIVDLNQMSLEIDKVKILLKPNTISFDALPKIFTSFSQKYEDLKLELHPKNPESKNESQSEEFVDCFT